MPALRSPCCPTSYSVQDHVVTKSQEGAPRCSGTRSLAGSGVDSPGPVPPDADHKKTWGQFFTSPRIATFMTSLFRRPSREPVRILDPGAGTGVLGLTAAERAIVSWGRRVHLTAVEREPGALRELWDAAALAQARLGADRLDIQIVDEDFLDLDHPCMGRPILAGYDLAISNPPYFKMSPSDHRGGGAPNAYARFMEVAARMLREDGQLCFIVPRSFAAGF